MEFIPLVAAVALIWKVVDFVRYLRARDVDSALTQGVVWVVGVAVAFLLAGTNWAGGVMLGDVAVGDMNWQSLLLVGLSLGSAASGVVDFKRAIDNTDSAAVPSHTRLVGTPVKGDVGAGELRLIAIIVAGILLGLLLWSLLA